MKRLSFLKTHSLPLVVITAVVVFLAIVNFTPGSWLSGWDNLHPEFNFALNIGRSISSVWQEYQGVGLLGGMSHAADLPRQLFLFVSSLILSPQILRYVWVWVTWWFGAVGAYLLATVIIQDHQHHKTDSNHSLFLRAASLITALGYLLNLATVQYYYVPYESFSSFFGGLPWLLWAVVSYYKRPSTRRLAVMFVISILASSAFYVQTLFVVFGLIVAVITLSQLLLKKLSLKHAVLAGCVLLASNLFWFLPSVYFTLNNSQVTLESKVNRLSTMESQLMNQAYGTPLNIAMLKGYWFGYQDYQYGNYTYLIPQWRAHVDQSSVVAIGVTIWVVSFLGICLTVRRSGKWHFEWLAAFLVVTLMLTSGNGPLGIGFTWASKNVPLFGQIFRTAFTKWSTAAALIYSIGLGSFSYWLMSRAKRNEIMISCLWLFVIGSSLSWLVWPAFQGNLISPIMRLQQPAAYQELFDFFQSQPKQTRVVTLPLPDFWAWNFYSWNYRGSGFLWYGIEQPILDRNFDVWSASNETFYNQLSTAFYAQDPETFVQLLQKYDVTYAVVDESIVAPNKATLPTQVKQLKQLLETLGAKQVWSKDAVSVYKLPTGYTQFVQTPAQYTAVWQDQKYTRIDPAFSDVGNYVSSASIQPMVLYPLAQLSREEFLGNLRTSDSLLIERQLPSLNSSSQLLIPPIASGSAYPVRVQVRRDTQNLEVNFLPEGSIKIADQTRELPQLPKLELPLKQALNETSTVMVTINGQPISIASSSAETTSWITLKTYTSLSVLARLETGNYVENVSAEFPAEIWANVVNPAVISIPAGQHSIQMNLATSWTDVPITGLASQNCEVFHRGQYSADQNKMSVTYEATDYASICTGTTIPLLNTKMSGLVRFAGQNSAGRSIKFYISDNNSNRADLEELVSGDTFNNIYTLLDWKKLPAQIYGINWETRSFGQPAINKLDHIQVLPLNIDRLVHLKVVANSVDTSPKVKNKVELADSSKVGTYQYNVYLKNSSTSGLLALSQGYHKGWIALAIPHESTTLFQTKVLQHVEFNGWANGWLLPQGEFQVLILFWPQILGFIGDAVAVVLAVAFIIVLRRYSSR